VVGLVDRGGIPADPTQVHAFVLHDTWADLQPRPGAALPANNKIDQTIAKVAAINQRVPSAHLVFKLRIDAGIHAPAWVKSLGGPPVTVRDPTDGVAGTIGRFWTPAYGQAYAALEQELAARYDSVPSLEEVTIDRCTTVYDEPFIRDIKDPSTVSALRAAGYSAARDAQCQRDEINAQLVWHHTRSGLALNPYDMIPAAGSPTVDVNFTVSIMDYCRRALGQGCVLENFSLRYPPLNGSYSTLYDQMHRLGGPIAFQTATPRKVGNLPATIQLAAQLGGVAVELPQGYNAQELGPGQSSLHSEAARAGFQG
jgi:hypothetical protein